MVINENIEFLTYEKIHSHGQMQNSHSKLDTVGRCRRKENEDNGFEGLTNVTILRLLLLL